MKVANRVNTGRRGETREPEADISGGGGSEHTPRQMTFAENVVLTVKVLTGFGLLGAALWGIGLLTSAR